MHGANLSIIVLPVNLTSKGFGAPALAAGSPWSGQAHRPFTIVLSQKQNLGKQRALLPGKGTGDEVPVGNVGQVESTSYQQGTTGIQTQCRLATWHLALGQAVSLDVGQEGEVQGAFRVLFGRSGKSRPPACPFSGACPRPEVV